MTSTPIAHERRYVMNQIRLLDDTFSNGLEAFTALARVSSFDNTLSLAIRIGGAQRGVNAMRRELLSEPRQIATSTGDGGPYRSASGLVLPPDHVVVPFAYAPTPSVSDLKRVYKNGVSWIFDGRGWRRHASAIVRTRSEDHIVWLAAPPREVLGDSEEIIAWGRDQRTEVAPLGYRPIMGQNELLDLHRAHPELYKQFWMVALGSFALGDGGSRNVAVLRASDDGPCLDDSRLVRVWSGAGRFPFVPQVSA
jgi:hypothetical protein